MKQSTPRHKVGRGRERGLKVQITFESLKDYNRYTLRRENFAVYLVLALPVPRNTATTNGCRPANGCRTFSKSSCRRSGIATLAKAFSNATSWLLDCMNMTKSIDGQDRKIAETLPSSLTPFCRMIDIENPYRFEMFRNEFKLRTI